MFLEKRPYLYNARVELLIGFGRILEAAAICAENGNMLKAVKILSAPATYSVDHARPMIDYLLTGLRKSLTLGVVPAFSPTASKLLEHTDRLDKTIMTEPEIDEVNHFHPFNRRASHPRTFSSRCSKRSNVLTVQVSVRSPKVSSRQGMTPPLCCAWTISSHPLSGCGTSRLTRLKRHSTFTLTTSTC